MASIVQNPNDVVCELPSQVICLGEALSPVIKTVRLEMTRKVRSSGLEFEAIADLSSHMGVITSALTHFSPRIEGLMKDVIRNEAAGLAEANRAAGRLEQVLSEFVEGYQTAKAAHAVDTDSREARSLLLGVYRHHVRVICDWLDDLVHAINNPIAALDKQAIPVTSNVMLTIALNMTSPPEMAKLDALAKRLRQKSEPSIEAVPTQPPREAPINNGPGILGTIGALAFGVGLTNAVFGRHNR
jgi:hypothetical protein